uniref:Transcriptional regulator, putative n=1 Tax=uncultured marine bacterium Ant24C4 TaxID=360425 RepID=Q2PY95_9BACT|nr:transcriptional regulator, putative [uncultured marine bacterium Ant24C4]
MVMLCECTDNCGDGNRQLDLLRSVDGVLVYPNKNSQAAFTGAAAELLPYCGQEVEVDGLEIYDEDLGAVNIHLVQKSDLSVRMIGSRPIVGPKTGRKTIQERIAKVHGFVAIHGSWLKSLLKDTSA